MTRIAATLLIALALGAGPAAAGDGSALNVLGFSPDGRYFAFEQYGQQDGSGAFYSIITAVEVASDLMVKGTPVTAIMDADDPRLGKEPRDKQLADIRAKAAADADAILKQIGIAPMAPPATQVAQMHGTRSRTVLDAEQVKAVSQTLVTNVGLPSARFGADARLVLREFDIALPRCKDLVSGEHPVGFGLTLERKGRTTIHLRRDQTIPVSRGCPEHYGFAELHGLALPEGATALAIAIQYFTMGFEGPDRRFLVVTGKVRP